MYRSYFTDCFKNCQIDTVEGQTVQAGFVPSSNPYAKKDGSSAPSEQNSEVTSEKQAIETCDGIASESQNGVVGERLRFFLHFGDMTDSSNLHRLVQEIRPDEVYNLAAQSHVQVSFSTPEYTADVDGLGTLRLLEAIRGNGLTEKTRFYQASTSELFGKVQEIPQTEKTPFYPRSPYACAKLYTYWITVNYREAYGMYACNGILFNHESPIRGETFVTRKITRALARIVVGLTDCLYLGNLNSLRDWGHARDYVQMQWLMLQQEKPRDFVIATGHQYSVRDFVNAAASVLGIKISWSGSGVEETGTIESIDSDKLNSLLSITDLQINCKVGDTIVRVDPRYFRPTEVETLLGNPALAKEKLNWTPSTTFEEMVDEMVKEDLRIAMKDKLVNDAGLRRK